MEQATINDYLNLTKQYSELKKQNIELKKVVACSTFLDSIQNVFCQVNNEIVRCGCSGCVDFDSANYANNPFNQDGPGKLKCSQGPMNVVPLYECLLYKYFKDKCVEFKVPVPNDKIDRPRLFPKYNLSTSLGRFHFPYLIEKQEDLRWFQRIRDLPFSVQVDTVYKMIHAMLIEACRDLPMEFDTWFQIQGIRL